MARLEYRRSEWQAIAQELRSPNRAAPPPGIVERIDALLAESPGEWAEHLSGLELNDEHATLVAQIHAAVATGNERTPQQHASVEEASDIIRQHQQRPGTDRR